MSVIPQEDVLVVLRSLVESIGKFQGFCEEPQKYLPTLLDRHHTQWMPRSRAEEDPSFKQLIPYCVLRSIDKDGASRFLPTPAAEGSTKHAFEQSDPLA